MLRIYEVARRLIQRLRPTVEAIEMRDRELGKQLKQAIMRTQTTKSAGQRDGVLDGNVFAVDDNALDKESDEPLAAGEIQVVESVAQGRSERGDVVRQVVEAGRIHSLGMKFLLSSPIVFHRHFESMTASLQLVDRQRATLESIDEAVNLLLQPSLGFLEAASFRNDA